MELKERERISWVDIAKGIGILFVILGHVYTNDVVYTWIYSFHMPLFFFMAGITYKKKSIVEDLRKRLKTIVIPYFFFGSLVLLYWSLFERKFRESQMTPIQGLLGLLRGQYEYLEFNVHLWFLPCFFVTVVLVNIIVNLLGDKIAFIIAIIMSVIYVFIEIPSIPWGIDKLPKYIVFYMLGSFMSKNETFTRLKYFMNKYFIGIEAMVLFCLSLVLSTILNGKWYWFIGATIGIFACVGISIFMEQNRILEYVGQISLIILCLHGPIYRVMLKIMSIPFHLTTDELRNNIFASLIVCVFTILICSGIYEILKKFLPWSIGKTKLKR